MFLLIIFLQTTFSQKVTAVANFKPLVLQWKVSHPRNTDQVSLIFRQKTVELVVNTSIWQKEKNHPRLGHFASNMTLKLKSLKKEIEQFHTRLKKTISVLSLIKDPRFQPLPSSHAPTLRINKEEIKEDHPYFQPLIHIIQKVWQIKWTCLECAIYQKEGNAILRTVKNPFLTVDSKKAATEKPRKKVFSKKKLKCISKKTGKIECIDPRFGIFKI